MNKLVLFSGGIDSSLMLYNTLESNNSNVIVLHIIIKNAHNRWEEELTACRKIVKLLKKSFTFEYIETTTINNYAHTLDSIACAFESAQLCSERFDTTRISEVQFGWIKNEDYKSDVETSLTDGLGFPHHLFNAATIHLPAPPKLTFPLINKTKKDVIQELTLTGLKGLTFSCRTPIDGTACGICKSCKENKYK